MQGESPWRDHLLSVGTVGVIAAVYWITGRLGLLLAIPPGYATAIWPPAGIALAGMLLYGSRMWPGIVLGSLLVNIGTSFEATSVVALLKSVALATSIGLGAALQASVGAALVRRCVGFPSALTRGKEIGAFLVLGGPVSCLINATIGVTTLWVGGVIPRTLYPSSWWTWWVGDTIGVLIVTPLVLSWLAEPRQLWRSRRVSMALPLASAFALAVIFFTHTSVQEQKRLQLLFEGQAQTLAQTLRNSLDDYVGVLHAIESFYASSQEVDRQEFHTFVQHVFARYPGLQAVSWDLRVSDAQRATYEETMRQDGYPDFQITEQHAPGQMIRAAQRPEYVSVTYIEPYAGNEKALGYNVVSGPDRLEALQQARDTGKPVATGRLTLVQETERPLGERQLGFLIFLPIYSNGLPHATVEERRQSLYGYVTGVFRIGDVVKASLRGMERTGMALWLSDASAPAGQRVLYDSQGQTPRRSAPERDDAPGQEPTGIHWQSTWELAGRRWTLHFAPTLEYLAAHQSIQPWTVLVGGLLFTGLLGSFLLIVTSRASIIEQLVAERTAELWRTNAALEQEITDHKQAQEALARLRQQHELILNAAGEGLLGLNPQGKVTFANPAAASMTGYTVEELIGQCLGDMVHHMQADGSRYTWEESPIYTALKAETAQHVTGEVFWRQNGTCFPVEYVSTPIREHDKVIGAVVTFQDITERQAMERMKEEFVSVVSHELRTPLTSMHGALGLLASGRLGILPPPGQHLLDIAARNTDRLTRLINDILDIERITSGQAILKQEPCEVEDLLQQAVESMQVMAEHAGVTLTVAPLAHGLRLWADSDRILQTLTNLLSNAIKFSPAGTTVWLQAMQQGEEVVFAVQDHGRGIPVEKLTAVFGWFQQVDASDAREKGGTGLGLAICRSIVQQHRGRIWAESTPGEGSTFYVALPAPHETT